MGARNVGRLVLACVIVFTLFALGERVLIGHPPPPPALIVRTDDAHRLLSSTLPARAERFLRDRLPLQKGGNVKFIALSFDDGPYPVLTPLLLDVLRDLRVKATFFLVGDDVEQFPELTSRIEAEGHEVADHTMTHPAHFESLSPPQVRRELLDGATMIERYAHDSAIRTMMRPPHGRFTEQTVRVAQQAGFHVILWNEDVGDWHEKIPPEVLARRMELHATSPDIVLLHSGRMSTILMLPEVVARFRKVGYTFVTVGELMRRVPNDRILHPFRHPV
jgi:chitin deacetylase